MNNNFFTRIDREILRLNPERQNLLWSTLPKHEERRFDRTKRRLLENLKRIIRVLTMGRGARSPWAARPGLLPPPERALKSLTSEPPRYFSKGSLDNARIPPIPYLLIETSELSKARPMPGNFLLLRSLAKGKGTLKKNSAGLFYLDIDDRFILSLLPYIQAGNFEKAPYFNLLGSPDGAHIPVIPPREAAFHYLDRIGELGKEFTFEIEGLYSIEPTLWPEVEEVLFFTIRSPELEALRQRQLLFSTPGGHPFHIAVAVKPRPQKRWERTPLPAMRINVAFLAA